MHDTHCPSPIGYCIGSGLLQNLRLEDAPLLLVEAGEYEFVRLIFKLFDFDLHAL